MVVAGGTRANSKAGGMHASPNRYFRPASPIPQGFPIIQAGTRFPDLEANPRGGELFEVGVEWHPKTGPYDEVKAGPGEGTSLLYVHYHVRPPFQADFRSSLEEALGDETMENGPNPSEEVWPDVQGYRLTLTGADYSAVPIDKGDVGLYKLLARVKLGLVFLVGFSILYWVVLTVLRKRLIAL